MRKRYVVTSMVEGVAVREGFSGPAMDALKRLGMVEFRGSSRTPDAITYKYVPKQRRFK
jgi:hypothetical protein